MSDPFIGEIKMFSFAFAPRFWAQANGQLLPIAQNQALFSLLGTTYGGNGQTTFALPNLQTRTPLHASPNFPLGQTGGEAAHTLTSAELPVHTHGIVATSAAAPPAAIGPAGALPALAAHAPYRSGAVQTVPMKAGLVQASGGTQPHENQQPYLVINFCIALVGIFPSRP